MGKLWCEIEDELLSLKNALQRGGESDCLYCLCNKKKNVSTLFLLYWHYSFLQQQSVKL